MKRKHGSRKITTTREGAHRVKVTDDFGRQMHGGLSGALFIEKPILAELEGSAPKLAKAFRYHLVETAMLP